MKTAFKAHCYFACIICENRSLTFGSGGTVKVKKATPKTSWFDGVLYGHRFILILDYWILIVDGGIYTWSQCNNWPCFLFLVCTYMPVICIAGPSSNNCTAIISNVHQWCCNHSLTSTSSLLLREEYRELSQCNIWLCLPFLACTCTYMPKYMHSWPCL